MRAAVAPPSPAAQPADTVRALTAHLLCRVGHFKTRAAQLTTIFPPPSREFFRSRYSGFPVPNAPIHLVRPNVDAATAALVHHALVSSRQTCLGRFIPGSRVTTGRPHRPARGCSVIVATADAKPYVCRTIPLVDFAVVFTCGLRRPSAHLGHFSFARRTEPLCSHHVYERKRQRRRRIGIQTPQRLRHVPGQREVLPGRFHPFEFDKAHRPRFVLPLFRSASVWLAYYVQPSPAVHGVCARPAGCLADRANQTTFIVCVYRVVRSTELHEMKQDFK